MNKITVIQLLNKKANGEKLPQKIKYLDEYYTLYEEAKSIENLYLLDGVRVGWFNHANFRLNTVIEVIEEQEEIDIQSIEEIEPSMNGNACIIDNKTWTLNQVIKAVKQLDKNIKEK